MPTPCYLSIEGKTQGLISSGALSPESVGNRYVQGHEDEILVQEIEHEIFTPSDSQAGQPTSPRVHQPLRVTTTLDKSTPLLYNALVSGESFPKVELKWYRTSIEGKQEHFFSTQLTDATVTSIVCEMPHCQEARSAEFTQYLQISLVYREIRWEHLMSGTSGSDDWRRPKAA